MAAIDFYKKCFIFYNRYFKTMAGKKMTTEISFSNFMFNAKLGTLNKLNPETIYVELGTFLTPLTDTEVPYEEIIDELEKSFRQHITTTIVETGIFEKNYICNFDIAANRMKINKKSFLFIQCHFKPKRVCKVTDMSPLVEDFFTKVSTMFMGNLNTEQFTFSKTKKVKTIYKETE